MHLLLRDHTAQVSRTGPSLRPQFLEWSAACRGRLRCPCCNQHVKEYMNETGSMVSTLQEEVRLLRRRLVFPRQELPRQEVPRHELPHQAMLRRHVARLDMLKKVLCPCLALSLLNLFVHIFPSTVDKCLLFVERRLSQF